MAPLDQYKLCSLEEFVSRRLEFYNAWTKVHGSANIAPWSQVEKETREEHAALLKMDPVKRRVVMFEQSKRNSLILSATKERLDRMILASEARAKAGDALRDAKEQEEHARRKRG